ncbi:MAG: PilZ domain-containing protein [Deltaproteobacteria bacterium]|nr:PilZ domain-containing protein [Deltaproteobacteria bacterium]
MTPSLRQRATVPEGEWRGPGIVARWASADERRQVARFRVSGAVRLSRSEAGGPPRVSGQLLDLSGGGALVELDEPAPAATGLLLARLELAELGTLAVRARAVHAGRATGAGNARRLGLRFHEPSRSELGELAALLSRATQRLTPFDRWDALWEHERRHLVEIPPDALARIALRGAGRVFHVAGGPGDTSVPPMLHVCTTAGGRGTDLTARPPAGWSRHPRHDAPLVLVWSGRRSLIVVRAMLRGDDWPAPLVPLQAALLRRRRHDRVALDRGALWARFDHPLLHGRCLVRPILDVGEGGLCLEGDAREDVLPPGLALSGLRIVLPDGAEVALDGTIRSVRAGREAGADRFGVELEPERGDGGWDRFVLGRVLPDAGLLQAGEVEQVWELFDRTGYLREKNPELLARCREPFQRTWRRLAAAPHLGAGIVVRDRRALRGAMFYTHAWPGTYLLHHLALDLRATDSGLGPAEVAGEVYRYVYHACRRMPDLRHAVGLFNVRSGWWRHLFDDFHALGPPADWYSIDRVRLVEAPVAALATAGPQGGGLEAGLLEADERPLVEQAVRRVMPRLAAAALALDPLDPTLAALQREFGDIGLVRSREVWVARRDGRLLGAAVADAASPGVNIFGLLDAVQLIPAADGSDEPGWPAAVLAAVAVRRMARGAETLTVMCPADGPEAVLPPAFVEVATLKRWTAARELLPLYLTYLDEHFDAGRTLDGEEPTL